MIQIIFDAVFFPFLDFKYDNPTILIKPLWRLGWPEPACRLRFLNVNTTTDCNRGGPWGLRSEGREQWPSLPSKLKFDGFPQNGIHPKMRSKEMLRMHTNLGKLGYYGKLWFSGSSPRSFQTQICVVLRKGFQFHV